MGEVDEFEDPVNEGVTDRDQRDDQAVGDADRQRLDQFLHALSLRQSRIWSVQPAVRKARPAGWTIGSGWRPATRYSMTLSNWNLPSLTMFPDMAVRLVSPSALKLHLPSAPS